MRPTIMTIAAALASLMATAGTAADLRVVVSGLRSGAGLIQVAVCPKELFAKRGCPFTATGLAADGAVTVRGIPPGVYAVQAFHDENGNGDLDRRAFWPLEGLGFSRDAPMRRGPPRFGDAAMRIDGNGTVNLTMRYFG